MQDDNSGSGTLPIAILGAGGHAQVIADALQANPNTADISLFFLDDDPATHGSRRLDIPVLGAISDLTAHPHRAVVIAIGNNRVRQRIAQQLESVGEVFATVVHPRATVARGVLLGKGTVIFANAVINTGSSVGAHVIVNTGSTIDHHAVIGDFVHVAPGAHTGGDVALGEGAFVGIGATVMPQRSVGRWATVGAGALVHRNVPDGSTVVGVPARPIRVET